MEAIFYSSIASEIFIRWSRYLDPYQIKTLEILKMGLVPPALRTTGHIFWKTKGVVASCHTFSTSRFYQILFAFSFEDSLRIKYINTLHHKLFSNKFISIIIQ